MNNNLSFLIKSNNVTIVKISKDLKVSRSTIYRILEGGNPSASLMLKLARYFDKDVRDIFFDPNVLQVVHSKNTA